MFEKKRDTDPYLDKLASTNPSLHQELLEELLKWPQTRQSLTRHGNTPSEILKEIFEEEHKITPYWITGILHHPNCPLELIATKIKSGNNDELLAISQNNIIDESTIRELAKSSYSPVWCWISRRPDCPPDLLEEFFSICEKQWESDLKKNGQMDNDNTSSLFDDEDYLFDEIVPAYSEVDEQLLEAIASNPSTPEKVFKKMMTMDLKMEWISEGNLGSTLLQNPSVSLEDKAFLSLQGIKITENTDQFVTSMVEHYGLPTSQAFEIESFPTKYLEALNEVGHPSALLHPELKLTNHEYVFNEVVNGWVKHETIYRTLWPELTERDDINFWYSRSSYDGDNFYFSLPGVELEHEFSRGSCTYNSMSYPFIDRPWVVTDEAMDLEMSQENFSYRDIEELFEYDADMDDYDLVLAAVIAKNSWAMENAAPLFSVTEKGERFVCEWAENFFEDDRDLKVSVIPEKALPYSWKNMSDDKKDLITKIIISGFEQKVDKKFQFAEHFLVCIALHKGTPDSIIEEIEKVDSKPVHQALNVR